MAEQTVETEVRQHDPEALLAEVARQREAREAAERRADQLENQVINGGRQLVNAQVQQFTTQVESNKAAVLALDEEIKGLKRSHVSLMQEGKFEEAADAAEKMAEAAARKLRHQDAIAYYTQQGTAAAAVTTDPVERFLSERPGQYDQVEQNWIKQNRRYATDPAFQSRVIRAHEEAVNEFKLSRGSPEYFQHLEKRGYMRGEDIPAAATNRQATTEQNDDAGAGQVADTDQESNVQFSERRPASPQARAAGPGALRSTVAAAPTRQAASPSGRRVVATLTAEQRETAMALASTLAPDEVLKGGEAAVLAWYAENNSGVPAQRMRDRWRDEA